MFRRQELKEERLGFCQSTFSEEINLHKPETNNMDEMFWDIERVLLKETKTWWDIAGLEKYLMVDRIPRGLRVIKSPTFGQENVEFMDKWDGILKECSKNLIKLIISEKKKTLAECKKLIELI